MNRIIRTCLIISITAFLISNAIAIANPVNVQQLFAGNTAFGTKLKWGLSISILFKRNGQIIIVDEMGKTSKGKWWVSADGLLCTNIKEKMCRRVSKNNKGKYQVHNHRDAEQIDWLIADISKGNPYGIK